jgi:hypothetical protein
MSGDRMKIINYMLCILLSIFVISCCAQETHHIRIPVPRRKFRVNVTTDNTHVITNNVAATTSQQSMAVKPAQAVAENVVQPVQEESILRQLLKQCWLYKGTIVMSTLALSYAGLLAKLLMTEYSLENPDAWSSWQANAPLRGLAQEESLATARALYDVINERYTTQGSTVLDPLVCFMNDVHAEISSLEHFITLKSWIAMTPLKYIVPRQEQALRTAREKIERLQLLQQILVAWLSEYKVDVSAP